LPHLCQAFFQPDAGGLRSFGQDPYAGALRISNLKFEI
jgi:hypothetical protein